MTEVLDRTTEVTWTHSTSSSNVEEWRRRTPNWLLIAGMTAATLTVSAPLGFPAEAPTITAIPVTHIISEALTAENNAGAQVRELKVTSGLTWAQFAGLFGVSRRAVHFWVEGGRMSADNQLRVERIRQALDQVGGTSPDQTRTALFTIGASGRSPFAELVAEVTRPLERPTSERSPLGSEEVALRVGISGEPVRTEDIPGVNLRKW